MCEKIIYCQGHSKEIDPCFIDEINKIKTIEWNKKFQSILSCCGHGKYPKTLVVRKKASGAYFEWFSGVLLNGTKRSDSRAPFYKRDNEGHYFIPELSSN